jgi:prevent-host-death family protein
MAVPKTIPAGEFKAKCLALIDEVSQSRVPLVVTKRGTPIAQVVPLGPVEAQRVPSLLGSVRYASEDDLLAPIAVAWNAEK